MVGAQDKGPREADMEGQRGAQVGGEEGGGRDVVVEERGEGDREGGEEGGEGVVVGGARVPLDVDVRGPVAVDVRDDARAALVQRGEVGGGGADGGGIEVVEGCGEGRESAGGC